MFPYYVFKTKVPHFYVIRDIPDVMVKPSVRNRIRVCASCGKDYYKRGNGDNAFCTECRAAKGITRTLFA